MVDWSFNELRLARVQAVVRPANLPSVHLLERLGFHPEGLLRGFRASEQGREDVVMYASLFGDWVAHQGAWTQPAT